jgi:hypothetical protein
MIHVSYNTGKPVITVYITALQCLRTLVPPKGRGGMSFGRLKYIIKKRSFIKYKTGINNLAYEAIECRRRIGGGR